MATLKLKPARGRTQKWKIIERGDRKLLKLLVPKVQQLLPGDIHAPRPVPLWHCPECGAAAPEHPKQCTGCETPFKSRGLAAALALAFPGAGLFYAGHPILATFDLFGEMFMYLIVAIMFLVASGPAEMFVAFVVGLVMLFFTKLESAHLASVLVHRTKADRVNTKWRRAAIVGAVVSVVFLSIPPMLSGSFGNKLDRDLDLSANNLGWSGGHNPEQWQYGVEPNQRSEWIRDDGQSLFVWSWTMDTGESYESLSSAFNTGSQLTPVETISLADLDGFRVAQSDVDDEGDTYLWVRWVLFDRQFDDVHVVGSVVYPDGVEAFEADINELLQNANLDPGRIATGPRETILSTRACPSGVSGMMPGLWSRFVSSIQLASAAKTERNMGSASSRSPLVASVTAAQYWTSTLPGSSLAASPYSIMARSRSLCSTATSPAFMCS